MPKTNLLRVYVDADVLYRATSASHQATASLALLYLGQATVLEVVTSRYTLQEALRNLERRSPTLAMDLLKLVEQSVEVVESPPGSVVGRFVGQADPKDLPNLAAAVTTGAHLILTFNGRDYYPVPELIRVMTPGDLVLRVRAALAGLAV